MIIIFSKHALKRMQERSISEKLATQIIIKPDQIIKSEGQNKVLKKVGNKVVIIIYKEYNNMLFVITVISSSKVDKYLLDNE